MLIGRPSFYIGVLDGNPAYLSYTKDSLTVEIFRDARAAKRKFQEIALVKIEPTIKVRSIERWEYADLQRKVLLMEEQLADLKDLRRSWWVAEQYARIAAFFRRIWRRGK